MGDGGTPQYRRKSVSELEDDELEERQPIIRTNSLTEYIRISGPSVIMTDVFTITA